jgi:hypothetical protein
MPTPSETNGDRPPVDAPLVFISYATEEETIASIVKEFIQSSFNGKIGVFMSSDLELGVRWLNKIKHALKDTDVFLTISSPSSLARPWINIELGCGWIKGAAIIPICHSGQGEKCLPFPIGEYLAVSLKKGLGSNLLKNLAHRFNIAVPECDTKAFDRRIERAENKLRSKEVDPLIIQSPIDRTKAIIRDLKVLLRSPKPKEETIWMSGFLTSFAIGEGDSYPKDSKKYFDLLLEEKNCLVHLARKGVTIKCILSPANEHYARHEGFEHAIKRTNTLLNFIESEDPALDNIDWTVAALGAKSFYLIGQIACWEGYKVNIQQGYGLSVRQASPKIVEAGHQIYRFFFDSLSANALGKWPSDQGGPNRRFLDRKAAVLCLRDSLVFLAKEKLTRESNKPEKRSA